MVKLHEMPLSIISDRATQFTSQFWRSIKKGFDSQVKLNTTFIIRPMVKQIALLRLRKLY